MAQARRYFEKALDNDKSLAEYFLNELQKVYEVEREIKEENKTKQEILTLRKERSRPILFTLENWLKEKIRTTTPANSDWQSHLLFISTLEKINRLS